MRKKPKHIFTSNPRGLLFQLYQVSRFKSKLSLHLALIRTDQEQMIFRHKNIKWFTWFHNVSSRLAWVVNYSFLCSNSLTFKKSIMKTIRRTLKHVHTNDAERPTDFRLRARRWAINYDKRILHPNNLFLKRTKNIFDSNWFS